MTSRESADGELVEVGLEDSSSIRVRYLETRFGYRRVLVIRYEGTYGFGSGGNADARYMCAMGVAGIEAFGPSGVLLDLANVAYEWGDQLENVFSLGEERPNAILVGPKCRQAIGTLIFGENDARDPTEREGFFDDLDAAMTYLRRLLEAEDDLELHGAARRGDYEAVQRLLQGGIAVDKRDSLGRTALHVASGQLVVQALVRAGAEVDARDVARCTPLHLADELDTVAALLASGADPDARSTYGYSALHRASSVTMVRLLVRAGADVNVRSRTSVLHSVKDAEVARALIEAGAPLDIVDENGETCLDRASWGMRQFESQGSHDVAAKYRALFEVLSEHGARPGAELRRRP